MKKEVSCFALLLFFILLSCFVFSKVTFYDTDIFLQDNDHKDINIDLVNEKNYSVLYSVMIFCNNCVSLENHTSDVSIKTFNNSLFAPNEKKTAILKVYGAGEILNTYYYDVLIFENGVLVKNQSLMIRGYGKSVLKLNNTGISKKSNLDIFSIKNPVILFLFLLVFCYFGLKLFLKTGGANLSKEMFFLVLILSTIVLTFAVWQVFFS